MAVFFFLGNYELSRSGSRVSDGSYRLGFTAIAHSRLLVAQLMEFLFFFFPAGSCGESARKKKRDVLRGRKTVIDCFAGGWVGGWLRFRQAEELQRRCGSSQP